MRQSIAELNQALATQPSVRAILHVQVEVCERRTTKGEGKPYYELGINDGSAPAMTMRIWSDHPAFTFCLGINSSADLKARAHPFVAVEGTFSKSNFGPESKDCVLRNLTAEEAAAALAGSPERAEKIEGLFNAMKEMVESFSDPLLKDLCVRLLATYGAQIKRAAAARGNHHARRGGLVEHTVMMMRGADALCAVYTHLDRSLLIAGALWHDIGKIVENQYEPDGFGMPFTVRSELYGHIAIGMQILGMLWRMMCEKQAEWVPGSREQFRIDCVAHMILSHHGEKAFGSPIEPAFPEAQVLHYLDQIDAKLEMMRGCYETAKPIGEMIFERTWPLPRNLVKVDKPMTNDQ